MAEFRGAENVHWYASQQTVDMGAAPYVGAPVEQIEVKPGKWVRATLQHAKKYGLLPGATAVLNTLAKPFLYEWGAKMACLGAVDETECEKSLAERYITRDISKEDYLTGCLEARDKIGQAAAAGGTVLHKFVELGVQGEPLEGEAVMVWANVKAELDREWPGMEWVAELPAVHPLGFGCRTDLLGKRCSTPVTVVDLKTRDFDADDVAKAIDARSRGLRGLGRLTPRETEPMQVAANLLAHGGNIDHGCGGNLYLSRTVPGLTYLHTYAKEEVEKAWVCFKALNQVYRILKGLE